MTEIVTNESPTNRKPPYFAGLFVSSVIHAIAVFVLLVAPIFWFVNKVNLDHHAIVVAAARRDEPNDRPEEVKVATKPDEVNDSLVEKKLNQAIEHAQEESPEENLGKLDSLAERLDRTSSEESIDKLAEKFQGWLGTSKRATKPAEEPVAGEFDYDTAQLHDVRRELNDDQSWNYWAIMIDAEGRTIEVEMTLSEGETMYKTMQRMKAFPLVDKVYRQITMPLLDKLLQTEKADVKENDEAE